MRIVELIRLEEGIKIGTLGILKIDKILFCYTLEPSDEENATNISSIPAQQYNCKRYSSEKYPNTFEITSVPGRSHILFHAGNMKGDTAGCILLGSEVGKLNNGFRGILNSGKTFQRFISIMAEEDIFHLTIKEDY